MNTNTNIVSFESIFNEVFFWAESKKKQTNKQRKFFNVVLKNE